MEPILASFNKEWESSLSGIFSNVEADQFMPNLYGPNNEYANTYSNNKLTSSIFLPIDETNMSIDETENANFYNFFNSYYANFYQFSEENSITSTASSPFFPTQRYENHNFFCEPNQMQVSNDNIRESTNISSNGFWVQSSPRHSMEDFLSMKTEMVDKKSEDVFDQANNVADSGEELKLKRKTSMEEHEQIGTGRTNYITESPKKKPRVPRDAQKEMRNALSKKNKKASLDDLVETIHGKTDSSNHPSSSSTEDENINNGSEASKGEVTASLNSSGKARASRGAATDPQSLYARKRRERINERLRILQKLVPNGTKVDISTMLEEAVQYVKFLKLQIKLLSSDEKWMFAPIAYNGMDMGLYDKVSL